MSTLNGYANPEGEISVPDGGMSGINLYSNSAPVVALPMGDYLGEEAPPAQKPQAAPLPVAPEFSIVSSAQKPRVLIPAAVGAIIGWCLAGDDDYTAKAKSAAGLAVGVGLAAVVGDWLSSRS